ncbi:MAG: hypothetical protein LBI29_00870, partial [Rickettsiales bacterium]|nr:hypothetical protein [Rickettsiales bacterium]
DRSTIWNEPDYAELKGKIKNLAVRFGNLAKLINESHKFNDTDIGELVSALNEFSIARVGLIEKYEKIETRKQKMLSGEIETINIVAQLRSGAKITDNMVMALSMCFSAMNEEIDRSATWNGPDYAELKGRMKNLAASFQSLTEILRLYGFMTIRIGGLESVIAEFDAVENELSRKREGMLPGEDEIIHSMEGRDNSITWKRKNETKPDDLIPGVKYILGHDASPLHGKWETSLSLNNMVSCIDSQRSSGYNNGTTQAHHFVANRSLFEGEEFSAEQPPFSSLEVIDPEKLTNMTNSEITPINTPEHNKNLTTTSGVPPPEKNQEPFTDRVSSIPALSLSPPSQSSSFLSPQYPPESPSSSISSQYLSSSPLSPHYPHVSSLSSASLFFPTAPHETMTVNQIEAEQKALEEKEMEGTGVVCGMAMEKILEEVGTDGNGEKKKKRNRTKSGALTLLPLHVAIKKRREKRNRIMQLLKRQTLFGRHSAGPINRRQTKSVTHAHTPSVLKKYFGPLKCRKAKQQNTAKRILHNKSRQAQRAFEGETRIGGDSPTKTRWPLK